MLLATILGIVLALATILVHYEVLRFTWTHLRMLPIHPRWRIIVVVISSFASHTAHVWIYGLTYWVVARYSELGGVRAGISDPEAITLETYVYFSAVTYTSLGFGDFIPVGHFRLLVGLEGLTGLMLIAWTASSTYLAMQEYWPLHGPRGRATERKSKGRHA